MAKRQLIAVLLGLGLGLVACNRADSGQQQGEEATATDSAAAKGTFGYDLNFLRKHGTVVVLSSPDTRAQVVVSPAYQGRVMTSTANGASGASFGWINYQLIASGKTGPHMNAFGGEDRFWLGPEGGQYGLYFRKGDPFDLAHWQTPAPIDTEPFEVVAQTPSAVSFRKTFRLENYSGTPFDVRVDRKVSLVSRIMADSTLGMPIPDSVQFVSFFSDNRLTNTGTTAWTPASGLLSVWILGMFTPSPATTIAIPYNEQAAGRVVNDAYFGKVPADRLKVTPGVLFFRGDGQYRSKIGLSPARAKDIMGSYDAGRRVLTLVLFTLPPGRQDYVNSAWEMQKEPYRGDAVNSYNDGPATPGAKPMGPFYELESSSPAAALKPGETLRHIHHTFHLQGPEAALNSVAIRVLGVSLDQIKTAFP
jgi:hypothetical protein